MQRGILVLSKEELEEIVKYINLDKFNLARQNIQDENKVFVNEEELENILDEIGYMKSEGNAILRSLLDKISKLLYSFRN